MANWYCPNSPYDDRLWLYSERGVMAYVFACLLRERHELILSNAVNGAGKSLGDAIGDVRRHHCLTEFDLGNNGFGKPDGGLFFQDSSERWHFLFVEAKATSWALAHTGPTLRTRDELSELSASDLDKLCRDDKFNSTINGQLELRWRFANAFQQATDDDRDLVIESDVSTELAAGDRFYWRRRLVPAARNAGDWRRVDMSNELEPLKRQLRLVEGRYSLLAITRNDTRPDMQDVRLFERDGLRMDEDRCHQLLYWMDIKHLTNHLQPITDN